MTEPTETYESLWEYCKANGRIVPLPTPWSALYDILAEKRQLPGGGYESPLPLILAAWNSTTGLEKQERFRQHFQWAYDHGQLDQIGAFLRSLPEDKWLHVGE